MPEPKKEFMKRLFAEISDPDQHIRANLIIRRKDNPNMKGDARVIKRYCFKSYEDFEKNLDEIIDWCNKFNARFYVNPTIKSFKAIAFETLQRLAENLSQNQFSNVKNLYDSVGDANTGVHGKRLWTLDIDNVYDLEPVMLMKDIYDYCTEAGKQIKQLTAHFGTVLTKTGIHVLVRPHNYDGEAIRKLSEKYGVEIELKKNVQTPIYWPGVNLESSKN